MTLDKNNICTTKDLFPIVKNDPKNFFCPFLPLSLSLSSLSLWRYWCIRWLGTKFLPGQIIRTDCAWIWNCANSIHGPVLIPLKFMLLINYFPPPLFLRKISSFHNGFSLFYQCTFHRMGQVKCFLTFFFSFLAWTLDFYKSFLYRLREKTATLYPDTIWLAILYYPCTTCINYILCQKLYSNF